MRQQLQGSPASGRAGALAVVICIALACHSPTGPSVQAPSPEPSPGPTVEAPALTCPAPISAATTEGAVAVAYQVPAPTGGAAPVEVACSPPSGASFAVGTTVVRCTATDAAERTGTCDFPVTVTRTPVLSRTRFLAFGDSVTAGVVATVNPSGDPFFLLQDVPGDSYPAVLARLLAERYPAQAITVSNEGKGGEKAVDGVGRAQGLIAAQRPEVVLLLDGYNDLSTAGEAGIAPAIAAITDIAKDARFRGARVFLATLTPPAPGGNRGIGNQTVVRFNEALREVARGEGAVL
ncbi:MAG: GDSL-type esterase/lipase family protein, partial [Vicinamibacterales bacterium]